MISQHPVTFASSPDTTLCLDSLSSITTCNINYSPEGIYHPDRILDEYDLLYMQNGNWDIIEDDICYHVEKNSVLLLEPGKHHFSQKKCSPQMRNMFLHFKLNPSKNSETSAITIAKLTDCSKQYNVSHYFEKIIELYWSGNSNHKEIKLTSLFNLLLTELADIHDHTDLPSDVLITAVIQRFYTSPDRFFSPEELANDYGISLRNLSSRFKKATGYSIHQYQIWLKLNMAYDILPLQPGRGLRDIALSFGFYDEFQFSKLFKRQFGISPSQRR